MSRSIAIDSRTINRKPLVSTAFNLAKNQNPQSRKTLRVMYDRKVCRKPGSVLPVVQRTAPGRPPTYGSDNHLSRPAIAGRLKRPTRTRPGQGLRRSSAATFLFGLAPDGVYQEQSRQCSSWSLTPRFHPCLCPYKGHRRSISVALSFGSRRLDVIQHPALWSPDFPPAAEAAGDCLSNFPVRNVKYSANAGQ